MTGKALDERAAIMKARMLKDRNKQRLRNLVKNSKKILDTRKTITWTGAQLDRATGPLVYIFWKDTKAMYVGSSQHGLSRPLSRAHHKGHARDVADRFEFICCDTHDDALLLERQLIHSLLPRFNEVDYPADSDEPHPNGSKIRRAIELDFVKSNCNVK